MYTAGKELFREQSAKMYSAVHKATNQPCVIEEFSKLDVELVSVSSKLPLEMDLAKSLDHPNILHTYEFLESEDCHFVVFENFECTLEDIIDQFGPQSVDAVGRIMLQVMRALQYTHRIGLVHKNLSLSTVVLKENNLQAPSVKMLRFGCPPQSFNKKELKRTKNFNYIAPELFMGVESDKSDIWSCGVIMHVLITGFDSLKKIHTQALEFPKKWQSVPTEVTNLVKQMVSRDPTVRPTVEEFMRHPWIRQFDHQMSYKSRPVRDALTHLCNQKPRSVIKEAIMTFVVNRIYSQGQLAYMAEIFRATDTDEDGRLTREDLADVLKKVMPSTQAVQSVDDIMSKTDLDGNGYITYSEFLLSAIEEHDLLSPENVQKVFYSLDKDDSGEITIDELKEAFFINGPPGEVDAIWGKILATVDKSGDGVLEFREFEAICQKALKV